MSYGTDDMTTHNHSCPVCGRVWEHGALDCGTGTSYLMDCPEETSTKLSPILYLPPTRLSEHGLLGQDSWSGPDFSANSVKRSPKVPWWRWFLIPVAAILGMIIAQLLGILVGSILPDRVVQLVNSLLAPVGFVVLGTLVVPAGRTQVAGGLSAIMLVWHGMFLGLTLLSGWYETGDLVFNSIAFIIGITGSVIGFFMARGSDIRRNTGLVLARILGLSSNVVPIIIFISVTIGVWWPIIKSINGSPVHALWLIPLGFLATGFAALIQTLIYSILVLPLTMLTTWLLNEPA